MNEVSINMESSAPDQDFASSDEGDDHDEHDVEPSSSIVVRRASSASGSVSGGKKVLYPFGGGPTTAAIAPTTVTSSAAETLSTVSHVSSDHAAMSITSSALQSTMTPRIVTSRKIASSPPSTGSSGGKSSITTADSKEQRGAPIRQPQVPEEDGKPKSTATMTSTNFVVEETACSGNVVVTQSKTKPSVQILGSNSALEKQMAETAPKKLPSISSVMPMRSAFDFYTKDRCPYFFSTDKRENEVGDMEAEKTDEDTSKKKSDESLFHTCATIVQKCILKTIHEINAQDELYLANTCLNDRLVTDWENVSMERRRVYLSKEEDDRTRYRNDAAVKGRHCATTTVRARTPGSSTKSPTRSSSGRKAPSSATASSSPRSSPVAYNSMRNSILQHGYPHPYPTDPAITSSPYGMTGFPPAGPGYHMFAYPQHFMAPPFGSPFMTSPYMHPHASPPSRPPLSTNVQSVRRQLQPEGDEPVTHSGSSVNKNNEGREDD